MFTDGMDWHSDKATFEGTVRGLDEEGVVVYPIRYDTRAATEALAREQASQSTPQLPTLDVVRTPPSGTTAPTFPSDESIPTSGSQRKTGPFGLPTPGRDHAASSRGGAQQESGSRLLLTIHVTDDRHNFRNHDLRAAERQVRGPDDSIKGMLDLAYLTADSYLKTLAEKSGGRLLRADTLASLPDAFSQIAAELRTQYMLGYYPLNKERDERYRKIKVTDRPQARRHPQPPRLPRDRCEVSLASLNQAQSSIGHISFAISHLSFIKPACY